MAALESHDATLVAQVGSKLVCVMLECNHVLPTGVAVGAPSRPWFESVEAVFRGAVVNSLEMPNGGFHYSVIDGNGSGSLARGGVVRWRLNDEVSALGSTIVAPDADAVRLSPRGHAMPAMNDASNSLYAGRYVKPAEQRVMQMTPAFLQESKSTSRSRKPE